MSEGEGGRVYTNLLLAFWLWLFPVAAVAGWLDGEREGGSTGLRKGVEGSGGDGGDGTEAQEAHVAAGWRVLRRALTPLRVLMLLLWSIRR